MTPSDSSSSGTSPAEPPTLDLIDEGRLPPLAAAFIERRDLDLWAPLTPPGDAADAWPSAPEVDREAVAAALGAANASYGHPRSGELAAKLADPSTRVVVTGQQPGLLGGPLYTLSKAVAAALWAERLEAEGQPAVALFWIATEDHDFREVSRAAVLGANGPLELDLGDDPAPLVPVGMRTFGPAVDELFGRLREANSGDRWEGWVDRLAAWYRPDAGFGEAFAKLLAALLGPRGPLLVDSMLPVLKRAEAPWMRRLVERREEVAAALEARDGEISARGHELQVAPQPGLSPLFVLRGNERRRVEWRGADRMGLRGVDGFEEPVEWLLEAIDGNPACVSPGVLARAPIQDAVFGSSVLVLGPGEISYMPQVAPLYELLEIAPPALAARPQALVVPRHQLAKLESLGLTLAELTAPTLDLDRALSEGREEDLLAPARRRIEAGLTELADAVAGLDPTLAGPWKKTRDQMERALETFSGKVAAAMARQNEVARGRAEALRELCRPLGGPQERVVAVAHFPGKYGDGLVEAFYEQLGLDPRTLHVVVP